MFHPNTVRRLAGSRPGISFVFGAAQAFFVGAALSQGDLLGAVLMGAPLAFEVWAGVALWRRPIEFPPGGPVPG